MRCILVHQRAIHFSTAVMWNYLVKGKGLLTPMLVSWHTHWFSHQHSDSTRRQEKYFSSRNTDLCLSRHVFLPCTRGLIGIWHFPKHELWRVLSVVSTRTMGYGKSHILAALACLLSRLKCHVVLIPDCKQMVLDPLSYIQSAFAYPSPSQREKLMVFLVKFCPKMYPGSPS